ncbi:MAG: long-chain fatty acid--CoA ligase, partial [Bacteroidota bacterium]
ERIMRDVDKLNADFSKWEQIKKVQFLCDAFTVEGGELTPTLKLKRKPILKKYADIIEDIYN